MKLKTQKMKLLIRPKKSKKPNKIQKLKKMKLQLP